MCGILFYTRLGKTPDTESGEFFDFLSRLRDSNSCRGWCSTRPSSIRVHDSRSDPQGPGFQQQLDVQIQRNDDKEDIPLHFFASELQLRGTDAAKQPHHDGDGQNIFCWNGEVRGGLRHWVSLGY